MKRLFGRKSPLQEQSDGPKDDEGAAGDSAARSPRSDTSDDDEIRAPNHPGAIEGEVPERPVEAPPAVPDGLAEPVEPPADPMEPSDDSKELSTGQELAVDSGDPPSEHGRERQAIETVEVQPPSEEAIVEPPLSPVARALREADRLYKKLPSGPSCYCIRCPNLRLKSRLLSMPRRYCEFVVGRPGLDSIIAIIVFSVIIGATWREMSVNTDISVYHKVVGNASRDWDVYNEALRHTQAVKNESSLSDRSTYVVYILYEAKRAGRRDESVFAEAVLRDVRNFEQKMRKLPGWEKMCKMSDERARFRCEPGESLGNYIWPRRLDEFLGSDGLFRLSFDGLSREHFPVDATLTMLLEGAVAPHDPWKFLPQHFAGPSSLPHLLRATFTFTAPTLHSADFDQEYETFVKDELYPFLQAEVENATNEPDSESWDFPTNIKIYFGGDELDDHEVLSALEGDMLLAIAALLVSFIFSWVHLLSIFLAFVSLLTLCLSVLLAHNLVRLQSTSLSSFLVVFIVFGFGGNSFFKLHDLWLRLKKVSPMSAPADRLYEFHKQAFIMLAPISMTALIFLVHLFSLLRPLREFGIFMSACILCRCILSMLIFAPAMLFEETTIERTLKRRLPARLRDVLFPDKLKLPLRPVAELLLKVAQRGGKYIVIGICLLSVIMCAITVGVAVDRGGNSLPQVFSPDHQRGTGGELMQFFSPSRLTEIPGPLNTTICEPWREGLGGDDGCTLHWCDVDKVHNNRSQECECYRSATTNSGCADIALKVQVAGNIANKTTLKNDVQSWLEAEFSSVLSIQWQETSAFERPSLVYEDWDSGETLIETLTQMPLAKMKRDVDSDMGCDERAICYCGERKCERPLGWASTWKMKVSETTRRLASEDDGGFGKCGSTGCVPNGRLLEATATGEQKQEIVIVYGIEPPVGKSMFDRTPEWSFDKAFQPDSPWSQRVMLTMCTEFPQELQVLSASDNCWVKNFRTWLLDRGALFPVQRFGSFHEELNKYLTSRPVVLADMWFNNAGEMRATRFFSQIKKGVDQDATLKARDRWLEHLKSRNEKATSTASKAWVTSQAWVLAEASAEALASTWKVTYITLAGITLAGLLYVQDFEIVAIILAISIAAAVVLSFFMVCMFQWEFGPWELTLMVVFWAYSVEPAFRIGRDFVFPPRPIWRKQKNTEQLDGVDEPKNDDEPNPDEQLEGGDSPVENAAEIQKTGQTSTCANVGSLGEIQSIPSSCSSEGSGKGSPVKDSPVDAVRRSVHHQSGAVLMGSLKVFICGWILVPCQLRLFSRLGSASVIASVLVVCTTLFLLPSAMLLTGRTRREPDSRPIGLFLYDQCSWIWS